MSDFKLSFTCPSCGSNSYSKQGNSIKCHHCGNLYRANLMDDPMYVNLQYAVNERQEASFDKARRRYEALLSKNKDSDSLEEVWWGRFLCEQYVIFYQNDAGESIPSFYNINEQPCTESKSYKEALKCGAKSGNADNYERLAELIEAYKRKYKRVKKEYPEGHQIFICFKDSGTTDANLGYKIYNEFAGKYNIFFSRESLNTISGNDYEPYIYHALTTAKILVVLCSSRESLESKWVHNEWWRYWKLTNGTDKTIIPIFRRGFDASQLPEEIRNCQAHAEDVDLISILSNRFAAILRNDSAGAAPLTSFEKRLNMAETTWSSGNLDDARIMINELLKESAGRPYDRISALLLQAKMLSGGFRNLKNKNALNSLKSAEDLAAANDIDIKDMVDHKRYRAAVSKKRMKLILLCAAAVIVLAGAVFGTVMAVQDPVVDMYVEGHPDSVVVEYGSNPVGVIPDIVTVTRKGNETTVDLNESMISGLDTTKIGIQTVTITYGGMTISLNIDVQKYTLAAPTGLSFENGKLKWSEVARAASYTLQINGEILEGVTSAVLEDYRFTDYGVYSVKVKAVADGEYGKDSEFSDTISLVKLKEASNLTVSGLTLKWDAVAGSTGYEIYLDGAKVASSVSAEYRIDPNLPASGANKFYVIPVGADNVKDVSGISSGELEDFEHNAELTVYKYKYIQGVTFTDGKLAWEDADATEYEILVDGVRVGTTPNTDYSFKKGDLKPGVNSIHVLPKGGCGLLTKISEDADFEEDGAVYLTKLDEVTGLSVIDGELFWDSVSGADSYEIYKDGTLIGTATRVPYTLETDLTKPGSASYTIKALGGSGTVPSDISSEKIEVRVLSAPTGVKLQADMLSWNPVTGAMGYRVWAGSILVEEVDADTTSLNMLGRLEKGGYDLCVTAIGNFENIYESARSLECAYTVTQTIIYVTNEAGLKKMSLDLNAIYVLGNDITLTSAWTPIGTTAAPFAGTFNGGGYTIKGLKLNAANGQGTGLFAVIGSAGVVEEVKLEGVTAEGGDYNCLGALAGINYGTVRGVEVSGSVSGSGNYVGGVIGRNQGSLVDCKNYASVTGDRNVGGVVGSCEFSNYDLLFSGCHNYGDVEGSYRVGGVAGNVLVSKKMTVSALTNEGEVTSTGNYAGGCIGYISGESGQIGTLMSAVNKGNVTADKYAAGCAGFTGSYVTVTVNDISTPANNCTNSGTITSVSGTGESEIFNS